MNNVKRHKSITKAKPWLDEKEGVSSKRNVYRKREDCWILYFI